MRVPAALRAATSHNFWISFRGALQSRRQFVGYVVGIYHNGKLQDMQAEPGAFAEKYPLPSSFKQDSH
jgi:hypothetical protein